MQKENILLYGEGGTGKTTTAMSVLKLLPKFPNLKVRFLCAEANALGGIAAGLKHHKIELKPGQLRYMVCRPNALEMVDTGKIAKEFEDNFLKKSESDALKVRIETGDRAKRTTFLSILKGMAVFKGIDYVSKVEENLGDYLRWDSDTVFIVDSLTSCVDYLVDVVKANRVATVQSDYNHVQTNLMSKIIVPLTEQCNCSVIMLGHPVVGEDQTVRQPKEEENKIMKLYPKTFGQALNNTIVSKFSETLFTYIDRQDNFYLAGKKEGVATSPRKIPRQDKLVPDLSLYGLFE